MQILVDHYIDLLPLDTCLLCPTSAKRKENHIDTCSVSQVFKELQPFRTLPQHVCVGRIDIKLYLLIHHIETAVKNDLFQYCLSSR